MGPGGLEDGTFIVHPGVRNFELTDGTVRVSVGVQRTTDDPTASTGDGQRSPFEGPGRRAGDGEPAGLVTPGSPPPRDLPDAPESPPPEPARVEYGQPVTFTFGDDATAPTPPAEATVGGRPVGGAEPPARATPADRAGQAAHDRAGAGDRGPLESPPERRPDRTSSSSATTQKPGRGGDTVAPKGAGSSTPTPSGQTGGGGAGHRPGGSTVELQPVQQQTPPPRSGRPTIRVDVGLPEPAPAIARPINRAQPGESAFTGQGRTIGDTQKPAPQGTETAGKAPSTKPKAPASSTTTPAPEEAPASPQSTTGQTTPAPPTAPAQSSAGGTTPAPVTGRPAEAAPPASTERTETPGSGRSRWIRLARPP
ncbi:hypothetical protein BJF79_43825 [Actinomadura sp. CNU-125]|nr:hypothetical protein BJF79_43825 [Actinomadura sp. CNU-125]